MRGRLAWIVVLLAVLAGCGSTGPTVTPASSAPQLSDAAAVPMIPRGALTGYVVRSQVLDAAALAADTTDPPAVEKILTNAGFQIGAERRFTAYWRRLTEIEVRALRFSDEQGAAAYVSWMASHGTDLLGSQAQQTVPPRLPGAIAFLHLPCDGCTKDPLQYLAAWTRGRYALTLLVGGAHAGRVAATPLARELDARVRTEG